MAEDMYSKEYFKLKGTLEALKGSSQASDSPQTTTAAKIQLLQKQMGEMQNSVQHMKAKIQIVIINACFAKKKVHLLKLMQSCRQIILFCDRQKKPKEAASVNEFLGDYSFKAKMSKCPVLETAAIKLFSAFLTRRGASALEPFGTDNTVLPPRFLPYRSSTLVIKP